MHMALHVLALQTVHPALQHHGGWGLGLWKWLLFVTLCGERLWQWGPMALAVPGHEGRGLCHDQAGAGCPCRQAGREAASGNVQCHQIKGLISRRVSLKELSPHYHREW